MRCLTVFCLLHANLGVADSIRSAPPPSSAAYLAAIAKGQRARALARYEDANLFFVRAAGIARAEHNARDEARALHSQSGCHIRLFQYRRALAEANAAQQLAVAVQDDVIAGAAANDRAAVYQQLGDFELAENASREAVALLERSGRKDYLAAVLSSYGDTLAMAGKVDAAVEVLHRAIEVARANGFPAVEAQAEDHLASSLVNGNHFAAALKAFDRADELHRRQKDTDALQVSLSNRAVLAYDTGHPQQTLDLLARIDPSHSATLAALPPFWEPKVRGEALQKLGKRDSALLELQRAVALAGAWRRSSLPSDATSTRTLVLLHDVYQEYIALAAQLSIEEHNPALGRRALSVLMEHRAATLREQMLSALGREMRLPPRYFELISEIQAAQARVTLGANSKDLPARQANLQQLRVRLAEMENSIGLNEGASESDENHGQSSLAVVQRHLDGRQLLLSFSLGNEKSYVWAVTNDKVSVFELPAQDVLTAHAKAFAEATRVNALRAEGDVLSRELFGKLDFRTASRPEWLITADGALLDSVPFSALPEPGQRCTPISDSHSLRFLPSELLLAQASSPRPEPRFVGVADPIYNLADGRRSRRKDYLFAQRTPGSLVLARLAGSEREVRSAAALNGFNSVEILSGEKATDQGLRASLATTPQVLHFAVHVVSPEARDGALKGEEAALALSLDANGMPQLLTKETIATLRVPGALVVLSGCASQQGETLPSAGLVGLSRAWLLAGASAVVVTAWPTPDDSGKFFTRFYGHLQAQSASAGNIGRRAAFALRQTQSEMRQTKDDLSQPSFWAAYSVISKE